MLVDKIISPKRLDVEFHLQGEDLANSLKEDENANVKDKENALIFMCCHFHNSLEVQYLMVRDPLELWNKLRKRYGYMKIMVLP